MGLGVEQPFVLENPDRLAQRRSTNAEPLRDLLLGHDLPGPEVTLQDRLPKTLVCDGNIVAIFGAGGFGHGLFHSADPRDLSTNPLMSTNTRS